MTNILGSDENLVARLADCGGTRCLRHDNLDGPREERVDPMPALICRRGAGPPTGLTQRAGIKQHKLPHRLVTSLKDRPMRTKFIDSAHPFLIRRIIGPVGDFRDFSQSPSCRFHPCSAFLFRLLAELSIGSQT
jgi:hypothetical protein